MNTASDPMLRWQSLRTPFIWWLIIAWLLFFSALIAPALVISHFLINSSDTTWVHTAGSVDLFSYLALATFASLPSRLLLLAVSASSIWALVKDPRTLTIITCVLTLIFAWCTPAISTSLAVLSSQSIRPHLAPIATAGLLLVEALRWLGPAALASCTYILTRARERRATIDAVALGGNFETLSAPGTQALLPHSPAARHKDQQAATACPTVAQLGAWVGILCGLTAAVLQLTPFAGYVAFTSTRPRIPGDMFNGVELIAGTAFFTVFLLFPLLAAAVATTGALSTMLTMHGAPSVLAGIACGLFLAGVPLNAFSYHAATKIGAKISQYNATLNPAEFGTELMWVTLDSLRVCAIPLCMVASLCMMHWRTNNSGKPHPLSQEHSKALFARSTSWLRGLSFAAQLGTCIVIVVGYCAGMALTAIVAEPLAHELGNVTPPGWFNRWSLNTPLAAFFYGASMSICLAVSALFAVVIQKRRR